MKANISQGKSRLGEEEETSYIYLWKQQVQRLSSRHLQAMAPTRLLFPYRHTQACVDRQGDMQLYRLACMTTLETTMCAHTHKLTHIEERLDHFVNGVHVHRYTEGRLFGWDSTVCAGSYELCLPDRLAWNRGQLRDKGGVPAPEVRLGLIPIPRAVTSLSTRIHDMVYPASAWQRLKGYAIELTQRNSSLATATSEISTNHQQVEKRIHVCYLKSLFAALTAFFSTNCLSTHDTESIHNHATRQTRTIGF